MRNFLVIANEVMNEAETYVQKISEIVRAHNGMCNVVMLGSYSELEEQVKPYEKTGIDAILVLGGDGTLIRCAGILRKWRTPLIGINLGNIGYLCEVDKNNLEESILQILKNDFYIEERMMLVSNIKGKNYYALNDITLYRTGDLRVIQLHLFVNGQHLSTYDGDGIVIATPTGSTGYSMSCGGPIVDPAGEMIVVTPISPHNLNARSIVLNSEDMVCVEVIRRHADEEETIKASCDGYTGEVLHDGDKICTSRAAESIRLIKLKKTSFLDILSNKMLKRD